MKSVATVTLVARYCQESNHTQTLMPLTPSTPNLAETRKKLYL